VSRSFVHQAFTAALISAAVFVSGCASPTALDRAIDSADVDAWNRAAPGLLTALRSGQETIVIEPQGEPGEIGLFTAYATPRVAATRKQTPTHDHSLHAAPIGGTRSTRREIAEQDELSGLEIAWFDNALDPYLIQVNGSAVLAWLDPLSGLPTGEESVIVWSDTNSHGYVSLGRMAIDQGFASEEDMSLALIRDLHADRTELVEALMLENPRYIFFRELDEEDSLQGSRGVPLVAGVSLATDPVHPTGTLLLLEPVDGSQPHLGLVHDGGAAIIGPQRVDRYLGRGDDAMSAAGQVVVPARVSRVLVPVGP
jgi:membrane-bound lytic murein transglycosylase A